MEIGAWIGIIVAGVGAISAICVAFINSYTNYLIKRLELKDKQQKETILQNNQKALVHDIKSTDVLKTMLEDIQKEVNCDRVNVWMFHNGGYYYTGESIQRMTMIAESNNDNLSPIKHKFTGIPVRLFARNLAALVDSNNVYVHERNELAYNDALSVINQEYKIVSSALFKIKSSDEKDWVGILAFGWVKHTELTDDQVKYTIEKTKLISQILTPDYLSN